MRLRDTIHGHFSDRDAIWTIRHKGIQTANADLYAKAVPEATAATSLASGPFLFAYPALAWAIASVSAFSSMTPLNNLVPTMKAGVPPKPKALA